MNKLFLNMKQNYLIEHGKARPDVMIVYFLPDQSKAGGSYITKQDYFKYFDCTFAKNYINGQFIYTNW